MIVKNSGCSLAQHVLGSTDKSFREGGFLLLDPQSRLLFIGDSITDCGRERGRTRWESGQYLGNGYVSFVHAALVRASSNCGIRILNTGAGGDTVRELAARWETDVLRLRPTWLSVMIGINDVWQHFDSFRTTPPVSQEEFRQSLDGLVGQIREELDGLVLMSPYYLEPNRNDPMRSLMDRFGEVVREIAGRHAAVFVDTQAAFDEVLSNLDPYGLAPDKVHVNDTGHRILARALLNGLEVDGLVLRGLSPGTEGDLA